MSSKYDELARANFERFMREYDIEVGVDSCYKDNKTLDEYIEKCDKLDEYRGIRGFFRRLLNKI